jgi:hypothetical protein
MVQPKNKPSSQSPQLIPPHGGYRELKSQQRKLVRCCRHAQVPRVEAWRLRLTGVLFLPLMEMNCLYFD